MIERAKYGSLKHLTKKQYGRHKADISKQWREDNPDKVKAYNHKWYELNRLHPKHECICKICGKPFKSYRRSAKICQKCLAKRKK